MNNIYIICNTFINKTNILLSTMDTKKPTLAEVVDISIQYENIKAYVFSNRIFSYDATTIYQLIDTYKRISDQYHNLMVQYNK